MRRAILSVLASCAALFALDGKVARDGFDLHYTADGAGRPIVFLSGGPGLQVDYMREAGALFPAPFQRIYLEQRGTGRSRPAKEMTLAAMIGDLEALRAHLGQERLLLAGHSWGAMYAMAYAAAHPDRVDRLVLIDSGGVTMEFARRFSDNITTRLQPGDIAARDAVRTKPGITPDQAAVESMRAMTPAYFFDRTKGLAYAKQMPDGMLHRDAGSALRVDLAKSYDVRAGLPKLARPILILHGRQDPMGEAVAEEIHGLIAGSVLQYFDACGHFPWVEQPDQFKESIARFLAR